MKLQSKIWHKSHPIDGSGRAIAKVLPPHSAKRIVKIVKKLPVGNFGTAFASP